MLKLLKYLRKYWLFALLAPICMIVEVYMDMLLGEAMEKLVDEGIYSQSLANVQKYGIEMLIILAIGVAGGILSGVFANLASLKFGNDLRKDLFKKIMNLSYNQTDSFTTGSLITRVTNDVTVVQNTLAQMIRMLVRCLSMFILGIIFTLKIDKAFAPLLIVALVLEIGILVYTACKVLPLFTLIQKKLDKVNTVVHENLTGSRVVKAFSKEESEYERFKNANNDHASTLLKVNKYFNSAVPLLMLVIYSTVMCVYYIGGHSVIFGYEIASEPSIKVGQISQAITYMTMICSSFVMLGFMATSIGQSVASSKRISEVLNTKEEIISGTIKLSELESKGAIEFKNVSFAYPQASGSVLENVSFKINQGETIAIVGSTGCGKSSLVNLLTRFYDATDGSVLINDVDIKELDINDLRNEVAVVLQKAELFEGTIAENIRWGKLDATDDEVIKAAKIAQAHEFIMTKESGYDEYVAEKGTSLSGGQKQRVSIARAIIKNPQIMIFDDATSALDLLTEANLYKAMKENIANITKIVVTQRVATAKNANRIIVLDNNTIVAFDSHDNLLKNCPVYQDIYNSQLKREDD